MTAPAIIQDSWPVNSSRTIAWDKWSDDAGNPITAGSMMLQLYDVAGDPVGAPATGVHVAAGAWKVAVPALGLSLGVAYRVEIQFDALGATRTLSWWIRAMLDAP